MLGILNKLDYFVYATFSVSHLFSHSKLGMRPADGLVTGEKNVTILPPNDVLVTREEVVCLTCKVANHS